MTDTPKVSAARIEAERSRARLMGTAHELQERLSPKTLARDAWKGAKWINRIELLIGDKPGFWEQRGYSATAYPWRNDRYG